MEELEEWRDIEGLEEEYQVSNQGRVRTKTRSIACLGGTRIIKGQILKLRKNRGGYLQVTLSRHRVAKTRLVHRLVCRAFHGTPPEGKPMTLHWDGDRENNHASNLRWGDNSENMADAKRHGNLNPHYSRKTECPRGHPYDKDNTYIIPSTGSRSCRTCKRVQGLESYHRVASRRRSNA